MLDDVLEISKAVISFTPKLQKGKFLLFDSFDGKAWETLN
jgi:hypothetical protein